MKIINSRWKLFITACFVQLLVASAAVAQTTDLNELKCRTITKVELRGTTLLSALEPFARRYEVPIGLELGGSARCKLQRDLDLTYDSITVEKLFASVLELTENCKLEFKDGVARFSPANDRSVVLDFDVVGLEIQPGFTGAKIGELISGNKGLRNRLEKENLKLVSFGSKDDSFVFSSDFKIKSYNWSLEGVLNEYIQFSRSHFWVMDFDEDHGKYYVRY